MVGWAHGGAPSAATEQTPTGLLVSLRTVVEENEALRPGQQSLIHCYAPSPSCCQMSYMQLLATLTHCWSCVRRHELLHLFAATWMQSSRTRPVSKRRPSQGASWNNSLHCCPTFLAGAGDMLQPASSSWPGVRQGPGAGQLEGEIGGVSGVLPGFIWPQFFGDPTGCRRGSAPGQFWLPLSENCLCFQLWEAKGRWWVGPTLGSSLRIFQRE